MTEKQLIEFKRPLDMSKGFTIDKYNDDQEYGESPVQKAVVVFKAAELLKVKNIHRDK